MPDFQNLSKIASSTVDALRPQPFAIALIVINLLFLIAGGLFVWYFGTRISAERAENAATLATILKTCGPQS